MKADATSIAGGKELLDQTLKAFGKLDILVLNAGTFVQSFSSGEDQMSTNQIYAVKSAVMGSKTLYNVTEEDFDQYFNSNVKGPTLPVFEPHTFLRYSGTRRTSITYSYRFPYQEPQSFYI